jgi:hypothetical protein
MVRSGVWDRKTLGKRSLGLRIPPRGSSRVRLVVRRVLEVQSTSVGPEGCLWAHSGRRHWWPLPSHLCRLTAALPTLSRGPENPLYPTSRLGSTAGRYPHSLGLRSPYHLPCSMHEAPGKGGCSKPVINLRTLCAHLGLAHHHTPPQRPSRSNTIIFTRGTTETDAHTFYPHCLSFPRASAHTIVYPVHLPPYPTQLYLFPPINLPLIPLPHIMGTPPCSNRQVTGTHPDINKRLSRSPQYDRVGVESCL